MNKGRGRPLGFKLSAESKKAISNSEKGQRHSEATKEKISRTLISYFRNMYPLSSELYEEYQKEIDSSIDNKEWFDKISALFDETNNIYTERSLNSKRFREISIEYNISMEDNPHLVNRMSDPEDICELKQQCEDLGLNFAEVCNILHIGVEDG
jgi:hypothetical protein